MPFPEATAVESILFGMRQGPVSPREWGDILQDLLTTFKPWLKEYRLDRLGDLKCVHGVVVVGRGGRGGLVPLKESRSGYSAKVLDDEGIFGLAPIARVGEDIRRTGKQYTVKVCGLLRNGKWATYWVTCGVVQSSLVSGGIDHVRKVTRKEYTNTDEFLESLVHPEAGAAVAKILTEFVREATERRKVLLEDSAERLAALEADNRAIAIKLGRPYVSWGH